MKLRTPADGKCLPAGRRHIPTASGDGDDRVVLVAPTSTPCWRKDIAQERVHDRETLLGAVSRAFDMQAPDWARSVRHRDDIIQDSCVIALSKIARAETEHRCPALIPEGLVYWVVRGAIRHRSSGDGRYMSTESSQARQELRRCWDDHVAAGGSEDFDLYAQMADQIRLSRPARRRPTAGYHLLWIDLPVDYQIHLAHEAVRERCASDIADEVAERLDGTSRMRDDDAYERIDQLAHKRPGPHGVFGRARIAFDLPDVQHGAAACRIARTIEHLCDTDPGWVGRMVDDLRRGLSPMALSLFRADDDRTSNLAEALGAMSGGQRIEFFMSACSAARGRALRDEAA